MSHNQQAVKLFNQYAGLYEEKYMNVGLYAELLNQFCDAVKRPGAEILDVACGPGNVAQYLLERRSDFQLLGADLSENMVELAKKNNPKANFIVHDAKALNSIKKKFDGIICSFLLPYFDKTELESLFTEIHEKLNEEGILYLSTIEDEYENSSFKRGSTGDALFMHFYPESYLRSCFKQFGFEVLAMNRISYPLNEESETRDIVFLVQRL